MLTKDEKEQLKAKGISEEEFEKQLESFKKGFPVLNIVKSASIGDGIVRLSPQDSDKAISKWQHYQDRGADVAQKFVPASGAASRMFKNLFEYVSNGEETDFVKKFFDNIYSFPFYRELDKLCVDRLSGNIKFLYKEGKGQEVVKLLLDEDGLNYGSYPKGMLPFHSYLDHVVKTPFEEHLDESACYTKNEDGVVKLHFTVSPEHLDLFKNLLGKRESSFKKENEVSELSVSFSMQDPSTDTIAVDMDNNPIKKDGKLLFRPGGHGSLLKNLNSFDEKADIVFIKNIDNVVPETRRTPVLKSTMELGGYFLSIRNQIWEYERELDKKGTEISHEEMWEIIHFCEDKLFIKNIPVPPSKSQIIDFLKKKLHRPIRVCGMVKNEGEPGGGPYYCVNKDQTYSLQILERTQIMDDNKQHMEALKSSTHFNPVNMVCGLKDYQGHKFDLTQYVDEDTAFISIKSKNGITLKALEHPGLWNGSMSDWITIFVEMPEETFNPVKTVNDLLRPMHQQL